MMSIRIMCDGNRRAAFRSANVLFQDLNSELGFASGMGTQVAWLDSRMSPPRRIAIRPQTTFR